MNRLRLYDEKYHGIVTVEINAETFKNVIISCVQLGFCLDTFTNKMVIM